MIRRAISVNIFILARDRYYSFDNCPGFWEFMSQSFCAGKLISARAVYDEIIKSGDPLKEWAEPLEEYFLPTNDEIDKAYEEIKGHVESKYEGEIKIANFLAKPDAWLIATARAEKATVVTNENLIENVTPQSEIRIPNVCKALGVKYETNIYPFMAQEKVKLVLGK